MFIAHEFFDAMPVNLFEVLFSPSSSHTESMADDSGQTMVSEKSAWTLIRHMILFSLPPPRLLDCV